MDVLLESELLPTFTCARHDSHHVTVTRQSEPMTHHARAQKRLPVEGRRSYALHDRIDIPDYTTALDIIIKTNHYDSLSSRVNAAGASN